MPRIRYIVTALGLFLLGTVPLHARAEITPVATVIPLNPFLTQQSRFTNVPYNIYPSGIDLTVIPMKEGNVKAGPFLLHPHLGIAENYTDNVLRTDKTFGGRTADWYTTYQPGLQIQLPVMGRHRIIMDYRAYTITVGLRLKISFRVSAPARPLTNFLITSMAVSLNSRARAT
ncbi:MAG: hypothetical protein NTX84_08355 [Nitrospirae bacterium]|nr:hypothetical protein [Nitrospirota bacterium]